MRPFDKPALSVEQQLELLKQRGLHITNDDRAMRFLEVVTLFRLSPYMRPFQEPDPEHTFKPGSTLKAIVDIYRFDGSLRRIIMDAIERVEVAVRATISNGIYPLQCHRHKRRQESYRYQIQPAIRSISLLATHVDLHS